jgi:hypothetical protein
VVASPGLAQKGFVILGTGKTMDAKKLVSFVVLALVAAVSHADGFFVNTSLGRSNYYPQDENGYYSSLDHRGYNEALRFGYRWQSDAFAYGLETGYANLGRNYFYSAHNSGSDQLAERIDGFMLGVNLKYSLPKGFYIAGHGGFFRSTNHRVDQWTYYPIVYGFNPITGTDKASTSGMGSYLGASVGYDFSKSFGVGLSYDRYREHVANTLLSYEFGETPRVDTYTLTAEYRF